MDSTDGSNKNIDANSTIFGKIEYVLYSIWNNKYCAIHYFC